MFEIAKYNFKIYLFRKLTVYTKNVVAKVTNLHKFRNKFQMWKGPKIRTINFWGRQRNDYHTREVLWWHLSRV